MSNEVQRWADSAMFKAEPIDADAGPKVHLLWMTADPLGAVAATCEMYQGIVITDLAQVSHADRHKYLTEVLKTHLKAPLEFVKFHFLIEGVTRAFTHQMVRQRTAVYAQESLRFAVKEDLPVGLPPSLAGTTGIMMQVRSEIVEKYGILSRYEPEEMEKAKGIRKFHASWIEWEARLDALATSDIEKARYRWDLKVERMRDDYLSLIDEGMPAEDARGLLPHNVLTRLHYCTDLRALLEHAGNRLCTQAQFEWRLVFARIAEAIRNYNPYQYLVGMSRQQGLGETTANIEWLSGVDTWQYEKIAELFKPICYQTGRCEFKSKMDRPCSIRDRVDVREKHGGTDSTQWHKPFGYYVVDQVTGRPATAFSEGIRPEEWLLDPGAARKATDDG